MQEISINWLALLAAVVAKQVIGTLWYAVLFNRPFQAETGLTAEQTKQRMPMAIAADIAGAAVMAFVLVHAIRYAGATTPLAGAVVGLVNWLGFIVVATLSLTLYEHRSLKLFAINNAYLGLALAIMGAILAVWR
jgi:hypothetical protein